MSDLADALAAQGVPITLRDGSTRQLCYTLEAMRHLDREFGTVIGVAQIVQDAGRAMEAQHRVMTGNASEADVVLAATYKGPGVFDALERALAPGLLDERGVDPRTGQEVWLGDRPDVVGRLLHPGKLRDHVRVFSAAIQQAFDTGEDVDDAGPTIPPPASPGPSGSISSSAKPGDPSPSSGE